MSNVTVRNMISSAVIELVSIEANSGPLFTPYTQLRRVLEMARVARDGALFAASRVESAIAVASRVDASASVSARMAEFRDSEEEVEPQDAESRIRSAERERQACLLELSGLETAFGQLLKSFKQSMGSFEFGGLITAIESTLATSWFSRITVAKSTRTVDLFSLSEADFVWYTTAKYENYLKVKDHLQDLNREARKLELGGLNLL